MSYATMTDKQACSLNAEHCSGLLSSSSYLQQGQKTRDNIIAASRRGKYAYEGTTVLCSRRYMSAKASKMESIGDSSLPGHLMSRDVRVFVGCTRYTFGRITTINRIEMLSTNALKIGKNFTSIMVFGTPALLYHRIH